ncbi:adenosylcobinamide-GDP ribazoletransferase [Sagittula sp. SSi028]|uniref:adenosylcobinamide-GDP ribazoletransferase n=1 Tax=Sagittula sp. SSi028 TaxID=3400636 RepID=UPI003AF79DF7
MARRRWFDEARLAVMFLTRLPVGRLSDPVPDLAQVRWAFPLVGLIVGAMVAGGWVVLGALGFAPLLAAALALAAQVMITGALHFDGLADTADGLGGGRDRAHVLQIMRDSRLGSYGAVALGLCALIWVLALADTAHGGLALISVAVASRLAMLVVLVELPAAREDGLGQSAGGSRRPYLLGAVLSVALMSCFGWLGLAAALAMGTVSLFVARRARRRIGGQTGDICGATQLLSETAGLAILSLA